MRFLIVLMLIFGSELLLAKRIAPVVIKPVIDHGIEYGFSVEYITCKDDKHKECGMQVFLIANDIGAEKTKWKRELYQVKFNRDIEMDVQTVFPRSLILDHGILIAIDERGSEFKVNAKSGSLNKPLKAIVYGNI